MKIRYQDFQQIQKNFRDISHLHRIAFCASLSERIIPNYNLFEQDTQRNYGPILRNSLNEVWSLLAAKQVDIQMINNLLESCENVIPEEDDNNLSNWVQEAAEAAACICHTLELCLYSNEESLERAVACVHNSLDYYLGTIISAIPYDIEERDSHRLEVVNGIPQDDVFKLIFLSGEKSELLKIERTHQIDLGQNVETKVKEIKKLVEKMVKNHPLLLEEIDKENEDLRRLRESPTLTPELLQWLRTSSENGGKSFLKLC